MQTTETGKEDFVKYLKKKAEQFEAEIDLTDNRFNKGYFGGKAEALYQVVDAILCESGELDEGR